MSVATGGTPVDELGEFKLIEQLSRVVPAVGGSAVAVGIGDDAAVWRPRPGRVQVASTDVIVQGYDFRQRWFSYREIGHKALAVNLSDFGAMGATPRLALVTIGLRGSERDQDIVQLYDGMSELARRYKIEIAGGDVTRANAIFINITVIGDAPAGRPLLLRGGARVGDVLGVTGPLGLAAAGLRVFEQELNWLDGSPAMKRRFLTPEPRVVEGRMLARAGAHAAIDLSDGLLGDLPKLCAASQVSAIVDVVRLPVPSAVRWAFPDWLDLATRGGEDFELLFAAPPEAWSRIERAFRRVSLPLPVRVGEIVAAGEDGPQVTLRQPSGQLEPVEAGAFVHFGPR